MLLPHTHFKRKGVAEVTCPTLLITCVIELGPGNQNETLTRAAPPRGQSILYYILDVDCTSILHALVLCTIMYMYMAHGAALQGAGPARVVLSASRPLIVTYGICTD